MSSIPVIDLFAGPGGLGEGFWSLVSEQARRPFDIRLSIEKEARAHRTLKLRSFYRAFDNAILPEDYYDCLRGKIGDDELYAKHPVQAKTADKRAWCVELGARKTSRKKVRRRIKSAIGGTGSWVLTGGPPCQAYSLAGRSRNNAKVGYNPAYDRRQRLYNEYLRIIADHWPAIFVMENVKGLLSATVHNQRIFLRIVKDLGNPVAALCRKGVTPRGGRAHKYQVFSLVDDDHQEKNGLQDFVIRAEKYGIPQRRHRIFLLGIRDDLGEITPKKLVPLADKAGTPREICIEKVIGKLPRIRSGLSSGNDTLAAWQEFIKTALERRWFKNGAKLKDRKDVRDEIRRAVLAIARESLERGKEFVKTDEKPDYAEKWFHDPRLGGVCNHEARTHMPKDLHRYLFASSFARACSESPTLADFPADILPEHENVETALELGGLFSDRFRVQLQHRASTTVTCHFARDGHYYIHYVPTQCRSLTVREAARLQTLSDNFFAGPRTSEYGRGGYALPPFLVIRPTVTCGGAALAA